MKRVALLVAVLAALGTIGLAVASRGPATATAQGTQIFLDYNNGPVNWDPLVPWPIPPFCTTWHEITPAFCMTHHTDDYSDNGDGVVSVCDIIVLNGIPYHVDEVGPTLYLDCGLIMEPADPTWVGGNPYNTQWLQLHPTYDPTPIDLAGWYDVDGSGGLNVCDNIQVPGGAICHVKRIGCNIRVSPVPNATEESTWGKIKGAFESLF
jgi:hypothetical protein